MELWEKLSAEDDAFHERMDSYESLPEEERIEKYRTEVKDMEAKVLEIVDGKYDGSLYKFSKSEDDMESAWWWLGSRGYALEKMFRLHCSETEVKRFEHQDAHLLELTKDMFARTGKMYRYILDMPLEEKDDDIEIDGSLRYWGESPQDILRLEDDEFYGSDFVRIIPIIATIEQNLKGDLAIIQCSTYWRKNDGRKSSMTDKELDIENTLDDGTTWAEAWLRHPNLDHIIMCYATHAIVTHYSYSIPDFLRMNTFEVKVDIKLQQICEQDGSRLWWWNNCNERQFADKFLHEAEHRPIGMSKGEFIWKRVVEYFEFEEQDESDRSAIKRQEHLAESFPDKEIRHDLFPADRMASLPDCRKDDSLIEEFLKTAYTKRP